MWLPRVSSSPTFLPESRSLEAAEAGGFVVRRVVMPVTASVSWTVVGPDHLPVGPVERYLAWLTHIERSPNTVRAYAHDLKLYWSFLSARCLSWEEPSVESLGEFTAWMRSPAENVVVLVSGDPRRGRRTSEPGVERGDRLLRVPRAQRSAVRVVVDRLHPLGALGGELQGVLAV